MIGAKALHLEKLQKSLPAELPQLYRQ